MHTTVIIRSIKGTCPHPLNFRVSIHILCPDRPQTVWCQSRITLVHTHHHVSAQTTHILSGVSVGYPQPLYIFPSSAQAVHTRSGASNGYVHIYLCRTVLTVSSISYFIIPSKHCAGGYPCSRVHLLHIVFLVGTTLLYMSCGYLHRQVHIPFICTHSLHSTLIFTLLWLLWLVQLHEWRPDRHT